ncbi:hypothetical protein HPB50_024466 [Hyalomma asiaticum]|uniref:Uncharacterized protein n=1 Tax=Hyalomma asiaticum TaxID=266040 RepID=A0ACB7SBZ5_HYAAI|nr:hypothetical protein HPB50_024466 [Hyalomma asiaticum]
MERDTKHTSCNCLDFNKMAKVKKVVDEAREQNNPELDLVDRGITSIEEIPGLFVPASIANLYNLEILTLCNNQIVELPSSISTMPKLKILNLAINRLSSLPRGFGAFPVLEVLDLTYNNLNEQSLSNNFFIMDTLRALYLGDNEFEKIPPAIGQLKNLQILSVRENDLVELPKELGQLTRLRELHIQGNRLTLLPPELGNLDLASHRCVVRMDDNPWVAPIADQLQIGVSHVVEYIRSETYKYVYGRNTHSSLSPPPKKTDKNKKVSKKRDHN